jgi:hypothetical protein
MSEDRRPDEPRTISRDDYERIQQVADLLKVRATLVAEAVETVGPNLTAVELWLSAPQA